MIVRAKRLGWDEVLTTEQKFDLDPYESRGGNLVGELVEIAIPATSDHKEIQVALVGGQEADPSTVESKTR